MCSFTATSCLVFPWLRHFLTRNHLHFDGSLCWSWHPLKGAIWRNYRCTPQSPSSSSSSHPPTWSRAGFERPIHLGASDSEILVIASRWLYYLPHSKAWQTWDSSGWFDFEIRRNSRLESQGVDFLWSLTPGGPKDCWFWGIHPTNWVCWSWVGGSWGFWIDLCRRVKWVGCDSNLVHSPRDT